MSKNSISDEDKALFKAEMNDVHPLKSSNKLQTRAGHKKQAPLKKSALEDSEPYLLSDFIQNPVEAEAVLSYGATITNSKRFKALQQGKISVRARLDLHYMNTEQARWALSLFIKKQSDSSGDCVLIIHGKGGEKSILKNLVNRWLPQIPEVLAFHSASGKDGGTGAVYVLLKKK